MITVSLEELLQEIETLHCGSSNEQTLQQHVSGPQSSRSGDCGLLRIHPLELDGAQVDLTSSETFFGRDVSADVVIDDRSVSRRHAAIERIGELYVLNDLGSTNGTYVNGKRVDTHSLRCGDRVRIGDQIFKFMELDGVEAQYHKLVFDNMSRDAMTGAYNKRFFTEVLERLIATSARDQSPVALVLLDIDHFKQVNDTHGHLAGDDVLKELSRRLTETLKGDDLFARYGGEEFVILVKTPSDAPLVAERCRAAVESAPFETTAGRLPITISLGVSARAGQFTPEDLIAASDAQLYRAKESGRNTVSVEESV